MTTTNSSSIAEAVDRVVQDAASRVPGVVAGVTTAEETLYLGASGYRDLGTKTPMTTDSVFAIFSTTKALTGVAALQLRESGDLDFDAPAKEYAPALGEVQVLEGFDDNGDPVLRAPKSDITTKQLLLHTAGFGYDFFNEQYNRLAENHGQPSIVTSSRRALQTPLLFDPGEQWEYGSNIDWAGQVIEGITGRRLGEVFRDRILTPLGMTNTSFTLDGDMESRVATMHQRGADGTLEPTDFRLPDPEVHMGGHGLYSTVGDYLSFIRMWLNDGSATSGEQILRPDTVEFAAQNHLGDLKVKMLPGVIPTLSNDAEFFPGQSKSWAYTFMVNDEEAPTGRPAGGIAWAGLANLYYWIDRRNSIGGYWATQIFPFADADSVTGYLDLETATYRALRG
ncbi:MULTISPECIES: serine hydrolase domain-containing protein [unclassified Gordonia (in: high G+C Gram-positive bacteria)]|uniref:serine hydrolase domain-containing protein n=1 Tax=unclassified Gordonia (in: high G+C Gram-positive bacteria) TaxID=2657482 RepID=UPI0010F73545|nr:MULTISPECIES: serine hydrolase domain-containing protein [unclassified Gordonia (in: high G+C Gram-positive bacteria)]